MNLLFSHQDKETMVDSVVEFGVYHQCLIAAEEFLELAHALLKINRLDVEIDMQEHLEKVYDEMADAQVVLGQLINIFDPKQIKCRELTDQKMARLRLRIEASQRIRDTLEKIDPSAIHIDNQHNLDEMILKEVKSYWLKQPK
jgi:hypothetical protein